jgi:aldehyde:ferredoxin oxidoreductase
MDAAGIRLFNTFAMLEHPETFQVLFDIINGFYGLNLTAMDLTEVGRSNLKNVRDFNTRAGFTAPHDRLPDFFLKKNRPLTTRRSR